MKRHVRTTLVYGLISALAVMPAASLLPGRSAGPWPSNWSCGWISFLCVLLARWSGKGVSVILFPMALLLGTALWPGVYNGFFFLGLGIFSWIRSGSCFCGTPVRAVAAEVITVGGGAGLVSLLGPGASVTWAISIWLFFLVQAVYFHMVPTSCRHGCRRYGGIRPLRPGASGSTACVGRSRMTEVRGQRTEVGRQDVPKPSPSVPLRIYLSAVENVMSAGKTKIWRKSAVYV